MLVAEGSVNEVGAQGEQHPHPGGAPGGEKHRQEGREVPLGQVEQSLGLVQYDEEVGGGTAGEPVDRVREACPGQPGDDPLDSDGARGPEPFLACQFEELDRQGAHRTGGPAAVDDHHLVAGTAHDGRHSREGEGGLAAPRGSAQRHRCTLPAQCPDHGLRVLLAAEEDVGVLLAEGLQTTEGRWDRERLGESRDLVGERPEVQHVRLLVVPNRLRGHDHADDGAEGVVPDRAAAETAGDTDRLPVGPGQLDPASPQQGRGDCPAATRAGRSAR